MKFDTLILLASLTRLLSAGTDGSRAHIIFVPTDDQTIGVAGCYGSKGKGGKEEGSAKAKPAQVDEGKKNNQP